MVMLFTKTKPNFIAENAHMRTTYYEFEIKNLCGGVFQNYS